MESQPNPTSAPFRSEIVQILEVLAADREREAIRHQGQVLTAGELLDLTHRLARAMQARGIGRGRTVTLLSGNLPAAIAARYAAGLLGCRVNQLYTKLPAETQAVMVRDVETHTLIVDPPHAERAAELTAAAPVAGVLALGPAAGTTDLLALAAEQSAGPFASLARPQDVRTIRHSGGTTGHSKGICVSYGQVRPFGPDLPGEPGRPPRLLVCTTIAHAAGQMADKVLRAGGSVVLLPEFDAATVLAAIESERITDLFLMPPLLYQLIDHPAAARTDTSSLRRLSYGGCQASPARIIDALRLLGPVLVQLYGQHEAGIISVLAAEDHDPLRPERLLSVGRIAPGYQVVIRDEAGRELPAGTPGEICVRSDTLMQGYWKQPELTAEAVRDGWLHTGDIGRLDQDGYLTIVDRLKDLINTGGGHVYTSEVEDLLNSHPQVRQSAVFGVRDADQVERVHAVVVPVTGAAVTAEELRALVRERRGVTHEPARIGFAEALPLTDAGKPDKKVLRSLAEQALAGAVD
ncbi:AMP-binding protein [Kitasatospora sp. NBC_01302]|uniref:AMP-binding protein n=1 Tax=Kitasatospora sp. NBC_01302 TaxID=2903575 RepID=UPI002E0E7C59|nr:AMP-binding protein [Kitasatospora sp. NBC_01302]